MVIVVSVAIVIINGLFVYVIVASMATIMHLGKGGIFSQTSDVLMQ
jgi:hypothetical protein